MRLYVLYLCVCVFAYWINIIIILYGNILSTHIHHIYIGPLPNERIDAILFSFISLERYHADFSFDLVWIYAYLWFLSILSIFLFISLSIILFCFALLADDCILFIIIIVVRVLCIHFIHVPSNMVLSLSICVSVLLL